MEEVAEGWRKLQRGGEIMVCVPHQVVLWSNLCWVYRGWREMCEGTWRAMTTWKTSSGRTGFIWLRIVTT